MSATTAAFGRAAAAGAGGSAAVVVGVGAALACSAFGAALRRTRRSADWRCWRATASVGLGTAGGLGGMIAATLLLTIGAGCGPGCRNSVLTRIRIAAEIATTKRHGVAAAPAERLQNAGRSSDGGAAIHATFATH